MVNIGILALQGSVAEHINMLSSLENVRPCEVRSIDDLQKVSGLILPGGESTTIGKLVRDFELVEPIIKRVMDGMPVWGTCAGMILMAKEIVNEDIVHLGLMDIAVRRNAYGGQLDSFNCSLRISRVSQEDIPLVFIRAPWVEHVWGSAEVLAEINNKPIAVQQGNLLATSFHPELTSSSSFHRYFVEMVREYLHGE